MKRTPGRDSRWRRTAAAIIAATALALLAACSGGSSSTGAGGTPNAGQAGGSPAAGAYSPCMRSHGVPNYPDPGSDGALPKGDAQQFGVSSSQLQAAESDCQQLYPANDGAIQQCETTGGGPQPAGPAPLKVM